MKDWFSFSFLQVHPEGKYVVDIDKNIDITKITPSTRVALRNDSYVLHLILPSKVDPLVNLMKVEKVPDSTYDMIGGLDQQIKEIKEVHNSVILDWHTSNICIRRLLFVRSVRYLSIYIWSFCSCITLLFVSICMHVFINLYYKFIHIRKNSHCCWASCLWSNLQVIELPIKHPELFESLGIAQPKVLSRSEIVAQLSILPSAYLVVVFVLMIACALLVFAVCWLSHTYHRVSCSMGHLVQEKHCWLGQ